MVVYTHLLQSTHVQYPIQYPMSLTDRAVRNLRATDKEVFISDGDGLYIRVRPTGSKTWVRRSQIGGKSKKLTLGEYPTMGLADARTTCLAVAARGAFLQKDVCSAYTDWIAALRKIRKAPEQVEARMQLHFLPYFGDRPVDELTRAELVDRLKLIAAKAPVQANRSLAEVKQFLDYCAESGWVKQSVLAGVTTRVAGGKEKTRDRTLDDAELTALLSILQHNWNPDTPVVVKRRRVTKDGVVAGAEPPAPAASTNTLFTDEERAQRAARRATLKPLPRGGRQSGAIDPRLLSDLIFEVGYHIERGVRSMAELMKKLLPEFGPDAIKPIRSA
jgi:hypothetical protein